MKLLDLQENAWVSRTMDLLLEVWWTSYLFIQVILQWSVHCCGTTGASCSHISQEGHLSETCRHAIITQTCSVAKLLACCIDMETCCEGRMGKGMDKLWSGEGKLSWVMKWWRGIVMKGSCHESWSGEGGNCCCCCPLPSVNVKWWMEVIVVIRGSHGHCHLLLWGDEGRDESWSDEGKLSLSSIQFLQFGHDGPDLVCAWQFTTRYMISYTLAQAQLAKACQVLHS